jgi:hypothetical protein
VIEIPGSSQITCDESREGLMRREERDDAH